MTSNNFKIVTQMSQQKWTETGELIKKSFIEAQFLCGWRMAATNLILSDPWATTIFAVDPVTEDHLGSIFGYEIPDRNLFYIGHYFVDEIHRGKGIGKAMWNFMLNGPAKNKTMFLDSTGEMTVKYRNNDFPFPLSHKKFKFQGATTTIRALLRDNMVDVKTEEISEANIDLVIKYDSEVAGRDRSDFLHPFLKPTVSQGILAIDKISKEPIGFDVKCLCLVDEFFRVGPLYADNMSIALAILYRLLDYDGQVFVSVPEYASEFVKIFQEAKFEQFIILERSASSPFKQTVYKNKVFSMTSHKSRVSARLLNSLIYCVSFPTIM